MSESRNITAELSEQRKAVERLVKLVAKRAEMLEAAEREFDKVQFKVTRRQEILGEHSDQLAGAQEVLAKLEAEVEAASKA